MDTAASSYRRYLSGEEEAFDEIVKELFDPLVFFVDRYVQDLSAAEDIAIDAFTEQVVHKHRYNFKVSLKTYLFMLGRSRALDYLRKKKRRREVPLTEKENELRYEFQSLIEKAENGRIISRAIDKLPTDMKTAINFFILNDS